MQGGQGPKFIILRCSLLPTCLPDDYFRAFSPDLPNSARYIFTISFRCQTFQLTNTLRGTMSRQIRVFARSPSFWLERTETDPKVVFSRPGSCLNPVLPIGPFNPFLNNNERTCYTFWNNDCHIQTRLIEFISNSTKECRYNNI